MEWHEDAACVRKENADKIDWFFSNNKTEIASAKIICNECPVRLMCAKWALEDKQREGVWGGMDQKRIKRTLSINWDGQEMRRNRFPKCPGCDARTLELITKTVDRPNGGRWATMRMVECTECGFEWQSRTSANAVDAYHAQRSERMVRAQKEWEKKRAARLKAKAKKTKADGS
jgi:WhiB family redox-sensing transcriptional regulator